MLILTFILCITTPNEEPLQDKIALVCPYDLSVHGGVQNQVCELAHEYSLQKQVFVFAPGQTCPDLNVQFEPVGQSVRIQNNGSVAPVGLDLIEAIKLARTLSEFKYVHIHEPYAPVISWPFLLRTRNLEQKVVLTFHRSADVPSYFETIGYEFAQFFTRGCVCVGVSQQAIRTSRCMGMIEIPNGIRTISVFQVQKKKQIVFVGRHEKRKGLEVLLKAYETLQNEYRLIIIGEGPYTFTLKQKYAHVNNIQWLGRVSNEERVQHVAESAVYCAPTLGGESFGIVLLEAMILKTPVVASDINGYREAAGGHACLVPPGRVRALRNALLNFRVDTNKAYEYASTFDIARLANCYKFMMDIPTESIPSL